MKPLAPIAAVAVASLLMASCQSKREICAQHVVYISNAIDEPIPINPFHDSGTTVDSGNRRC